MKKSLIALLSVLSALLLVCVDLQAQRNPRATAKFEKGGQFVIIEYGRPSLKGRDMFAQLQAGKIWRMGADKSTTLTCSSNISFGKTSIPQGSYSLWLRKVDDKNFQLLFNKTTGQWGTEHAREVRLVENGIEVLFSNQDRFSCEMLQASENMQVIKEVADSIIGRPQQVKILLANGPTQQNRTEPGETSASRPEEDLLDKVKDDSSIKAFLEVFQGKITDVKDLK